MKYNDHLHYKVTRYYIKVFIKLLAALLYYQEDVFCCFVALFFIVPLS